MIEGRRVGRSARLALAASAIATSCALGAPVAEADPHQFLADTDALPIQTTVALTERSDPEILGRIALRGRVPAPGPNQWVTVTLAREGHQVLDRRVLTDPISGRYRTRVKLKGCCEYLAQARSAGEISDPLRFEVNGPPTLEPGPQARLFNQLLRENGYHMGEGPVSDYYDESTALGIMALRKVHDLYRTEEYAPKLFELLLSGDAELVPEHDDPDRHVEVDVSRQVMALVEDGKATDVFHVSTGSGGTPTGEWTFYDQAPGYNAKGMYYSSYYDGNYATHGYASVPTYPASHGCTRNPMPYAVYIYDWIELGMPIYVYY